MSAFDGAALASADPAQFASMIKSASRDDLEALMNDASRGKILEGIFNRFPGQFRADRAGSTSAVVHWNITGRPDGGLDSYELTIADGACKLSTTPEAEPKLAVTMGAVDFLQLVAGAANPMMMFMTGKLKAKGDLGLAANLANLFDLPKA